MWCVHLSATGLLELAMSLPCLPMLCYLHWLCQSLLFFHWLHFVGEAASSIFFVLVSTFTSHSSRQQLDQYSHMHVCAEGFAVCHIFVDARSPSTAYRPRLVNILLTTRDMLDGASITFTDAYLPSKACEQFAGNHRQWLVMASLSLMPIYHQLTAVQGWWIVCCQPQRQPLVKAMLSTPTHRQLFTIQSWQTVCWQQLVTASSWLKRIHRRPYTIQREWLMLALFWRMPVHHQLTTNQHRWIVCRQPTEVTHHFRWLISIIQRTPLSTFSKVSATQSITCHTQRQQFSDVLQHCMSKLTNIHQSIFWTSWHPATKTTSWNCLVFNWRLCKTVTVILKMICKKSTEEP